ncbi:MAG: hypothetical protein P4L42_03095 [Desulfocapsaceae bacterium]|nr:hypothetical protein [Desulfocapsaceae bacterium]
MDLLRQIENEIKPAWDNLRSKKKDNDMFEDCEPNMLIGWTDKNPSIWDVSGDNGKPKLEKILFALCRRKKQWDKITYIKFKKFSIEKAGLGLTCTNGNTSDPRIDTSNTHYEIREITAKQLCTLIYYISIDEFEIGIFKKADYDKILLDAYEKTQSSQVPQSRTSSILEASIPATSATKNKEEKPEIRTEKKIMNKADSDTTRQ